MPNTRTKAARRKANGEPDAPNVEAVKALQAVFDPLGSMTSLFKAQQDWARHPGEFMRAMDRLAVEADTLQRHAWRRALGLQEDDAVKAVEGDERFAAPEWSNNPFFSLMKQSYLGYTRWLEHTVFHTPDMPKDERTRAAFWTKQWFNALAPTNFFFTNPVAIQKYFDSHGESVKRGLRNWAEDKRVGDVQMVDSKSFSVGKNLATTPGSVVFRNELIELIRYAPMTETVHAVPLVLIPPWINKFYILDLNEKKSMVRYLLRQGYSVFVVSWKNPDASMSKTTMDDYTIKGALAAIEAARAICDVPQVHAVGYCLGGTTLAMLMAWLNREYENKQGMPVAHWTTLATLTDFSRPGEIEIFLNEDGLRTVEETLERQGFLDGREMSRTFRMLRPNSLIWHYYVHSYLYGEAPPALDVLYWNTDTTRLPAAMHSFYLRNFYVKNLLAQKDGLTIAGHPIDLGRIKQPLYAVGTEEDHITPWKGTFKSSTLVGGPVRYVLSTSGHILGIINPPVHPPKRAYWVGKREHDMDHKEWRAKHAQVPGTWWEDWDKWLAERCGPMQAPPPVARPPHQVLCAAPGTFVVEH